MRRSYAIRGSRRQYVNGRPIRVCCGSAIQRSGPDSLGAVYLSASAACALYFNDRLLWYIPATIGLVALLWAGVIVPDVWGQVTFNEMFETWKMTDPLVEEAREMCGLLLVAFWMVVLVIVPIEDRL